MAKASRFPLEAPTADVGEELAALIKVTGTVQTAMGGYRILVHHAAAFPWDKVLKLLTYRSFKVYVTAQKADLQIDAEP